MKRFIVVSLMSFITAISVAAAPQNIRISTEKTDLILEVAKDGRLYQLYFGEKLMNIEEIQFIKRPAYRSSNGTFDTRSREICSCNGNEDYFEPALGFIHADGNRSTYLYYESHTIEGNETTITLKDNQYPVTVKLHYIVYPKENIIKTWSEICHNEKKPIKLTHFYSTMVYLDASEYYLTEYSSDWASEMRMNTQQLQFGKKIVDTKLGTRTALHCQPYFIIGMDKPAEEHQGTALLGAVAWPGNFRYTLEVDNTNTLCILPGINNTSSEYELKAGDIFKTAEFIFCFSSNGISEGSRSFHDWARKYQIKNGEGNRLSLLNNWENTYFNFDQQKLSDIMKEAKKLGVDLFLLDDGWFANGADARNDDTTGLGDWDANKDKLPGGIPYLVNAAKEAGVGFGIWIEPEMVNPQSSLFREHPDWAITQSNREPYYFRNQLVLDLSNPKVQDYVYSIIEKIMKENPEIAFIKWDCNSPITNIHSPFLKDKQGQMYIDHTRGVINIMKRAAENYPETEMMLCSGGGGRCDFESIKYFTEFWPSDNTNPIERLYIQWGFSQFLPAKATCAHVTSSNRSTSIKFRTDVASMCKLGFDIGLKDMSASDLKYCQEAIKNWRRLQPTIMDGDQYRLVSPYETNHMVLNYVSKDKESAVIFVYDIHPRASEQLLRIKLQGLDPTSKYKITEINLMPETSSSLEGNNGVYSGDYLMKVGINAMTRQDCKSRVIELTKM